MKCVCADMYKNTWVTLDATQDIGQSSSLGSSIYILQVQEKGFVSDVRDLVEKLNGHCENCNSP